MFVKRPDEEVRIDKVKKMMRHLFISLLTLSTD